MTRVSAENAFCTLEWGQTVVWGKALRTGLVLVVLLAGVTATVRAQEDPSGQNEAPGDLPTGSQMVRGTVMATSADGLTVKAETGVVYRVTTTSNTRLMRGRDPVKLADIKAGDGVGAMGVMDASAKTLHAMFVAVVDAEQVKKAQADLGKTYIAGEVTAMDDVKLTIKRLDGVVQTIAVDEGTSFRRGGRGMGAGGGGGATAEGTQSQRRAEGTPGESITLADVKVGDRVVGRGALKGGVFVPTELRVSDVAARARRRSGTGGSSGTTPLEPGGAPQ